MRKLRLVLALSLLTFTFGGVSYAIDLPSDPGMIKRINGSTQGTATRVYKLVRFASNIMTGSVRTISAGEAVVYDTNSDDGVTVRRTTLSGDGAFAGIAVTSIVSNDRTTGTSADDDAGNENWGYIIVHGPTTALTMATSEGTSVGDIFITSSIDGAVAGLNRISTDAGAAGLTISLDKYAQIQRQFNAAGSAGGFFLDTPSTTTMGQTDVFVKAE